MSQVSVTLNGEPYRFAGTVAALVERAAGGRAAGVAVAVDGVVVPRSAWETRQLTGGESVELLTAVQGG